MLYRHRGGYTCNHTCKLTETLPKTSANLVYKIATPRENVYTNTFIIIIHTLLRLITFMFISLDTQFHNSIIVVQSVYNNTNKHVSWSDQYAAISHYLSMIVNFLLQDTIMLQNTQPIYNSTRNSCSYCRKIRHFPHLHCLLALLLPADAVLEPYLGLHRIYMHYEYRKNAECARCEHKVFSEYCIYSAAICNIIYSRLLLLC